MNKMLNILTLLFCFSLVSAHNKKESCYIDELKRFKKAPDSALIFDEDAHQGLASIQKSLEICKDLSFMQRMARFMFILLDPVIVTPKTMPHLYAYVEGICKKANIATPVIFITSDKHGFLNAFASKLFATTGGIIVGQKMIYETTQAELEAILAHEIGHIKHNHVNKSFAVLFAASIGSTILTNLAVEGYRAITNTSNQPYTAAQLDAKFLIPLYATIIGPKLIINKRFEREADQFAFENGRAQGVADFFQYMIEREAQRDKDFDETYSKLQEGKSRVAYIDYLNLMFAYYLNKGGHYFDKAFKYVYHHTPLGAHPSNEDRIAAAQDYLASHSDWNVVQN